MPVDESLAPRVVCRLGTWPRQTPVRICSFTRARVGRLHDEHEEREETGPGRGHSRSRPQGDRNAGRTQAPGPAPRPFPASLFTRNLRVHPHT